MKLIWPILVLISHIGHAQDAKLGEKLYQTCIQCHGQKGEGNTAQEGPKLAGQYDWYVESQLKAFITGKRSNPKMMPYIKGLSDKEIKDLSAYISTLKI